MLTMESIKAALEEQKKAIETKLNSVASADEVKALKEAQAGLNAQLKQVEDSLKLMNSTKVSGMDDEKKKFSIGKALLAMDSQQKGISDAWNKFDAGFEKECLDETAKKKIATVGDGSNAGYLLPFSFVSNLIELALSKSPLFSMGIQTLSGLAGDVYIPKQTARHSAYYVGENEIPTESNAAFGQVKLSQKRIAARTKLSRSLISQAINADAYIIKSLSDAVRETMHKGLLYGTGGENQPLGIVVNPHTQSYAVGTNGGRFRIDAIEAMKLLLEEADELDDSSSIGLITRPTVISGLRRERVEQYSGQAVGMGQPIGGMDILLSEAQLESYTGIKIGKTTQLSKVLTKGTSSTCTYVILGDMSKIIHGVWADMTIETSNVAANAMFENAMWVVAQASHDIAITRGNAFAVCKDAETLESKWNA